MNGVCEMKKIISSVFIALACLSSSAYAEGISLHQNCTVAAENRDGSSIGQAIIIKYIGDYSKSIAQEYEYLSGKFGVQGKDWKLIKQSLLHENGRSYDKMDIQLMPLGEEKTLYFDITEPFGFLTNALGPN